MKKLNTPAKVQDFLDSIKVNFEKDKKDTIKSPVRVLREGNAHCIEGAILGAYILSLHGHRPFLLHLRVKKGDFDHVIAPFKYNGFWGALSKTNHPVLRYRDPVYRNVRELVMSYFHEYFLDDGRKTLLSYSKLLDLSSFEKGFELLEEDLWGIDEELDRIKHYPIAPKENLKKVRKASRLEIMASSHTERI